MRKKIVNFDYETDGLDTVTKYNLFINDLNETTLNLLEYYK